MHLDKADVTLLLIVVKCLSDIWLLSIITKMRSILWEVVFLNPETDNNAEYQLNRLYRVKFSKTA